jgi:hypothetical protein
MTMAQRLLLVRIFRSETMIFNGDIDELSQEVEDVKHNKHCPNCDDECQECPDCVDNPDIPDCMKPVNGHFC